MQHETPRHRSGSPPYVGVGLPPSAAGHPPMRGSGCPPLRRDTPQCGGRVAPSPRRVTPCETGLPRLREGPRRDKAQQDCARNAK